MAVISDPIADMLTRIRNANSSKHKTVDIPASNMKLGIAEILFKEGYIKSFEEVARLDAIDYSLRKMAAIKEELFTPDYIPTSFIDAIDEKGRLTEVAGRYEGMDLATCKAKTIEDLKDEGYLLKQEKAEATYVETINDKEFHTYFLKKEKETLKS